MAQSNLIVNRVVGEKREENVKPVESPKKRPRIGDHPEYGPRGRIRPKNRPGIPASTQERGTRVRP